MPNRVRSVDLPLTFSHNMNLNSMNLVFAQVTQLGTVEKANPTGQMVQTLVMFAIMGLMFYLVLIRPQQKRAKEHAKLMEALKAGDKIVTSSGIIGVVVAVKGNSVSLRSADTKLEVLKSAVTEVTERSGEVSETKS